MNQWESVFQATNWYNQHTIFAAISQFSAGQNHEKGRFLHFAGIDRVLEF